MMKVTENEIGLLSGIRVMKFFPAIYHSLNAIQKGMNFTVNDTLIFSQLAYLFYEKKHLVGAMPSEYYFRISYSKLRSKHISWLSQRTIIRCVKKLEKLKLFSVENSGDVNRYSKFPTVNVSDENFILFYPAIAQMLDNDVATLLLQRIHYISLYAGFIDISYPCLVSELFDVASESTVIRAVKLLVDKGLVKRELCLNGEKKTYRYQFDYKAIQLLLDSPVPEDVPESTKALHTFYPNHYVTPHAQNVIGANP